MIYCSFCCIYVWLDPGTYMIARFMFFYKPGVTPYLKQKNWSRRWSPTRGGVMNDSNPAWRACILSKRRIWLPLNWTTSSTRWRKGASNKSMLPYTPWVRTSRAKSVVMKDIRGTTAPKPVKTAHISTTTTTTGTVHNKEARGGTSHVHLFREVTTTILLIIRISIQTNLPWENLFLAKLKSTKI